jgi:hypothetical protein
MDSAQLELQLEGRLGHPDRTPEHERNEREAAAAGFQYPELTRTLWLTSGGIRYEIFAAIMSWRVVDDCLFCSRCGDYLGFIAPNLLHPVPLVMCDCSAAFMKPVDERDYGLLELTYPVSDSDHALAQDLYSELTRVYGSAFTIHE